MRMAGIFIAIKRAAAAAGFVFALMMIPATAALANVDGVFVCTTVNDAQTSCVAYAEVTEGTATLGDIGLTSSTISYSIMFGLGLVLALFALGAALGAARRLFDGFFSGDTLQ